MLKTPKLISRLLFIVSFAGAGLILLGSSLPVVAAPDLKMQQVCQFVGATFVGPYDDTHTICSNCPTRAAFDTGQCTQTIFDINNTSSNFVIPAPNSTAFNNMGKFVCASHGSSYVATNPPTQILAADGQTSTDGFTCKNGKTFDLVGNESSKFVPLEAAPDTTADISCADIASSTNNCILFKKYIIPAINFLTVGVGVIVTIMVIAGGIVYSSAGGDPKRVRTAKLMITNALLSLLAFIFLWAFLQWIVPGGIL